MIANSDRALHCAGSVPMARPSRFGVDRSVVPVVRGAADVNGMSSTLCPVSARGDVDALPELAGHVALVSEPTDGRDIEQRSVGPVQKCLGTVDPLLEDKFVRCGASGLAEAAGEVVAAEPDRSGEIAERHVLLQVLVDVFADGAFLTERQPVHTPAVTE